MSRPATARLFVAVDLPSDVTAQLHAWGRAAAAALAPGARRAGGGVRVLDEELLHVTVWFLGSRPVAEIEPLAAALPACAAHAGELSLGAPLWLPPRRPQALAVEVHDDDGELARLHAELAPVLAAATDGWEPERRRFRAHVTVARMRAGTVSRHGEVPPTPAVGFAPPTVSLYRSWLGPDGASYEPLVRCALLPSGG